MNKKRTLAMLLAGAMLLPANAFAASPEDFTDFPTDWSAAGLRSAVQNGLLNGSNGQINSSGLLIRAQMAAIVNRAFAARKTADLSVYSDANASAWYYNDLELAVAMRTFQGANGKLNPEAPITREEAFVVLARAFALESGDTSVLNHYTDGASVSAWAQSSVAALIENGYVNGANGKLNPKTSITRAEFAKVISEMASTYADADDSLSATVDGSVIVRENSVSLAGKTINGDLIIADGVSRIDLTGVTVTGRIVLRGGESGVTFKDTKAGKGDKKYLHSAEVFKGLRDWLNDGKSARSYPCDEEEKAILATSDLLTLKPVIFAANLDEAGFKNHDNNPYYQAVVQAAEKEGAQVIPICANIEADIAQMDPEDRALFLEDLGVTESGLDRLIRASYSLLGLISYLTCGEDECRAWTIPQGTKAPQAAGKIHTDFERGFIRAEVVAFADLEACGGSMTTAKEKGLVRSEGKDYVMKDGDVVLFRFNV